MNPQGSYDVVRSGVHGLLLAAGRSRRYGERNKLLEWVKGEAMVRQAALTLLQTALDRVMVVVGYESKKVRWALHDLNLEILRNPDYADGQSTSVRRGVEVASERRARALLIALGDMPCLQPNTVNDLIRRYQSTRGSIVAPWYRERRGNPVLFDRCLFPELENIHGDRGARALLEKHPVERLNVQDPGVVRDVDEPGDLSLPDR